MREILARSKVLVISYLDYRSYFGLSRRIAGLVRVLKRNNIDVQILCPRHRSLYKREEQESTISFDLRLFSGTSPERSFSKLICILLFTIMAVKHITRNRKNWTIIQYESFYSSLPAIVAKFLTNALIIGDELFIPAGGRLLDTFMRSLAYGITATSSTDTLITSSLTSLRALQRFAPGRCMYVPNGIDVPTNIPPRQKIERGSKCIAVFVGSPNYAENRAAIEQLLRLPREMQDYVGRFLIWIVGGPLVEWSKHMLNDEFVKWGVVKFWGTVNDETLERIYQSTEVALLPFFEVTHESGGQRIKALECFAHELVVVSTDAGVRGLADLIDGVHFVRIASIKEMAEAFKKIIDNRQEYSEIAARGRMYVASSLSWNAVSKDYLRFVKRALGS
jgi:glycosyltransferase involved in cell wall biosynthesis